MKIDRTKLLGLIAGIIVVIVDFVFFMGEKIFMFIIGIAIVVGATPFILGLIRESRREQDVEEKFLEFSRNLAESVMTGTPISKSIVNISKKNYGALTPHVQKLSNQIQLGIPLSKALQIFANDIDNIVVTRAVALISEAEKAGGEIDYILDSVAKSIAETEKLKKERKAAIFNLVMQGYIIFFIFIGIMLVMEFKILPLATGISGIGSAGAEAMGGIGGIGMMPTGGPSMSPEEISNLFLYLLLTQGFFAGLTIGKLSEGSLKSGIKHSFILTIAAFLISTGVRALLV